MLGAAEARVPTALAHGARSYRWTANAVWVGLRQGQAKQRCGAVALAELPTVRALARGQALDRITGFAAPAVLVAAFGLGTQRHARATPIRWYQWVRINAQRGNVSGENAGPGEGSLVL